VQILTRNFPLKLLALGLAIVGWAYFRFATNPIVAAARFDQQISLPISAANLPVGYVAHFSEHQAVVSVESRRGEPAIKPDEIKAVLDLSNKETGVYDVPVALVAPDVVVQSLSPASVLVTIEKMENRPFTLTLHYAGAENNGVVVSDPRLRPRTVTVQGPTTALSQVATVQVDIPFPSAPKNFDEMVRPVAVDANGSEVPGLEVAPNLIRVQMNFVAGTGAQSKR
jgi:YbbR domain-containing protein